MRGLKRLFMSQRLRLEQEVLLGLVEDYNAELQLAQQLRAHADDAPYTGAAERLRQIAGIEEEQAERLRAEIVHLGGFVSPPTTTPRGGRNHWARLVHDLDDDRAAGRRYLEQAIRWERTHPDLAQFLRSLESEEQAHRAWLQDLIARSDPQALN
jgi:hypothetical protein